ncbi:MAG: 6-phosphogluconolactonase [Caldilineaceae bacterium]|nr:6-phosphogluconolactonase [Caldilineaceae bacterium]MDE0336797.1 6-phosphogluconolactonase [Caldilineaceae bacterium]
MTEETIETQSVHRGNQKEKDKRLDKEQRLGSRADSPQSGRVIVQPNGAEFALTAAGMIAAASMISIEQRGVFSVALAGGSTPGPVYDLLAEDSDIDWKRCRVFWSDERCVPPEHAESNYRMARERLLDRLPEPPEVVSRIRGELPPDQAAYAYEQSIRENVPADGTGTPRFDLILLGMGDDGHTASLFPGSSALDETDRLVAADYVSKFNAHRLTFTYPLINAGRHVLILVSGASKAVTLKAVLEGPHRPVALPVQGVQPAAGQFRWLVDADAALCIRK